MNPSGRNEQLNCSANVHRPRTSRNGDSGRARFRGSKGLSPKYRCDCQGGNADGDCVFGKDVVICYGDLYPWVKREAGYLLASDQADEPAYRRVLAGYDMVSAALVSLHEQARIKEIPGSEERTRADRSELCRVA